jgi:hypothetical protein
LVGILQLPNGWGLKFEAGRCGKSQDEPGKGETRSARARGRA